VSGLVAAFVLHHRPYRNTSVIADLFTETEGRVSAVVRGVRTGRGGWRGLLQAFSPLWVNYTHRGELKTLTGLEPRAAPWYLQGLPLVSGLYLNELLLRVLPQAEAFPRVFLAYQHALDQLNQTPPDPKPCLRSFELTLLQELGYGLDSSHIESGLNYFFDPANGLQLSGLKDHPQVFAGEHLLAMAEHQWDNIDTLHAAKRLVRLALKPLLGHRPLRTVELLGAGRLATVE
jgi:DNA repair protein RecO (recombination protein O)